MGERKEISDGRAASGGEGAPGDGWRRARPPRRDQRLRPGSPGRRLRGGRDQRPGDHPPQLRGGGLHQLDGDRPDRGPAREGARLEAPPPGLRSERSLRRDLRHHPPLGLRQRLPGRRERHERGIGLLVTLLIRVNREKQRLLTYGLSEHYRNIFQITRLDDAITIYDSEEAAVQAADSM